MQLTVIEHAGQPIAHGADMTVIFRPPGGTIGRASENDLVLQDDTRQISRLQALLQIGEEACSLKNLSSVSTIEVNRVPIRYAQAQLLKAGDLIRIGTYVLRADLECAAGMPRSASHGQLERPVENRMENEARVPTSGLESDERLAAAPDPGALPPLSVDPLDLFESPQSDIGSYPGAPGEALTRKSPLPSSPYREAMPLAQFNHVPDWASHIRLQPAVSETPPSPGTCPSPAESKPTSERSGEPATSDALVRAFFEGAGIDMAGQPRQWTAEQSFIAGQLLALFANGTVELLSSRNILKREVKADMTMLLDRENNPLKLLPDGGAVLKQMLGLPFPGFMSPQSAVSDAFQDLHAHQIGMVSGMRAALTDLLARFSPQRLSKRNPAPRWYERYLPPLYKARMWDCFAADHRNAMCAIEDDFASVFGKAFLDAYDLQVANYRGRSHT